jgi:ferredoxin
MPEIEYEGEKWAVPSGVNLRKALMKKGLSPYKGQAKWLNCQGMGTCGTCALELLSGEAPPPKGVEKWRLNFPPHKADQALRLACQIKVETSLKLKKHPGFWGEKKS